MTTTYPADLTPLVHNTLARYWTLNGSPGWPAKAPPPLGNNDSFLTFNPDGSCNLTNLTLINGPVVTYFNQQRANNFCHNVATVCASRVLLQAQNPSSSHDSACSTFTISGPFKVGAPPPPCSFALLVPPATTYAVMTLGFQDVKPVTGDFNKRFICLAYFEKVGTVSIFHHHHRGGRKRRCRRCRKRWHKRRYRRGPCPWHRWRARRSRHCRLHRAWKRQKNKKDRRSKCRQRSHRRR
jgi:hypothetical protein